MVPLGPASDTVSVKMVGNTLLKWGTEEQKHRFLPRILSGDDTWCQGFSEPNAGSDLAGLSTRAVLEGDEWVIDGQKIWTSFATRGQLDLRAGPHRSDRLQAPGHLVPPVPDGHAGRRGATDPDATGGSEFNEVFFDGARIPKENVVGPVHGGWAVAMSLLGHERGEEAALNPIMFRARVRPPGRARARVRARRRAAHP